MQSVSATATNSLLFGDAGDGVFHHNSIQVSQIMHSERLRRNWTHRGRSSLPPSAAAAAAAKTSAWRRVAMTTICWALMPDDARSQWNSQRGTSPFFICSGRVLFCPCVVHPSVGQCRAASGIELYVWPSRPATSPQIYTGRQRHTEAATAASGRARSQHALSRPTLTFVSTFHSSLRHDDARVMFHFSSPTSLLPFLLYTLLWNNFRRKLNT